MKLKHLLVIVALIGLVQIPVQANMVKNPPASLKKLYSKVVGKLFNAQLEASRSASARNLKTKKLEEKIAKLEKQIAEMQEIGN